MNTYLADTSRLHTLKAPFITFTNLRDHNAIALQFLLKFPRVKLTITPPGLYYPGLLLKRKVLPGKTWPQNIAKESKYLVVRNCAGVGKVEDASVSMLS